MPNLEDRDALVEALREPERWDAHFYGQGFGTARNVQAPFKAADHIEALTARVKELEEALPQNQAALRAATRTLRDRYTKARCDDEGVADCIRCNTMFLVQSVEKLLDRSALNPSPTEQGEQA